MNSFDEKFLRVLEEYKSNISKIQELEGKNAFLRLTIEAKLDELKTDRLPEVSHAFSVERKQCSREMVLKKNCPPDIWSKWKSISKYTTIVVKRLTSQ